MAQEPKSCCGSLGPAHKKECPTKAQKVATAPTEAVDAPIQPEGETTPSVEEEPVPELTEAEVAAELAAAEAGEVKGEAKPVAAMKQSAGLDLSMFTPTQIAALKEALDATGLTKTPKKKGNSLVELREIEGMPVIDFSRAYKKTVFDEEQQRNVVRTHIKVRCEGETAFREIMYRDWNHAPRISCEVVATTETHDEVELGEVWSAQHKMMVPNVVKYVRRKLTIKKPDGSQITIDADKVN